MPSSEFKCFRLSDTLLTEYRKYRARFTRLLVGADFFSTFFLFFSLDTYKHSSVQRRIDYSTGREKRTVNATAAKASHESLARESEQCTRKPVTVISSRGLRAKKHARSPL